MKTAVKTAAKTASNTAAKRASPASAKRLVKSKLKPLVKARASAKPKSTQRKAKTGFFITFEGGEGVGKTTQIARLAKAFEATGRRVIVTREPGGSNIANRIRSLILDPKMKGLVPLAELFLYEASRAQHVADVIRPALKAGHVVICDRYTDSSVVYQGVARGLDGALVKRLNNMATGSLHPDLTLLLDLDPRIGLARVGARGILDRMEKEALSFHQAVRAGFLKLSRRERRRFRVIDSSLSRDAIHAKVLEALEGEFV
ncbi:MAG: dTMP kinase [Proteobacteria bacterium]|nr:MAG: dTMP kinase [Pseudomonadota bacterium]